MIPILYKEDETIFGHNGIGLLYESISCNVREVRNGAFELELIYPISGQWFKELKDFRLISAKPNDEDDPHLFRIFEILKNLEDNTVAVSASTKSNDLGGNIITPVKIVDKTPQIALNAIKEALVYPTTYNFISNIQTKASGSWKDLNPLNCISGSEGSMLSIWGGEIKRTDSTLYLYGRRGRDNVTTIRPGKGLKGFDMTVSTKGMTTAILPIVIYTIDDTDEEVVVRGNIVNSPKINNYPVKYIRPIDYSSKSGILPGEDFPEDNSTTAYRNEVLNNLNSYASDYFEVQYPGSDVPNVTINVDMLQLADSVEYDHYKGLESIGVTDTVTVWIEKFEVDVTVKVQEILYDSLAERVLKIVAGSAKHSLYKDVSKTYDEKIDKVKEYVDNAENGIYNTIRIKAEGKNNIFSGYTQPDEGLLKIDDIWYKPVAGNEVEMYRWDGTGWILAVGNADKLVIGSIDSNIINLVNLNASNISTGTITGANGYWNLDTGYLSATDVYLRGDITANRFSSSTHPQVYSELGVVDGYTGMGIYGVYFSQPWFQVIGLTDGEGFMFKDYKGQRRAEFNNTSIYLNDGFDTRRFEASATSITLSDSTGTRRFEANTLYTMINDTKGITRFSTNDTQTIIRDSNENARMVFGNSDNETYIRDYKKNTRFNATDTLTILSDTAGTSRFYSSTAQTNLNDINDVARFYSSATQTNLKDSNNVSRFVSSNTQTYIQSPDTNTYIVLSNTGASIVVNGVTKASW